MREVAPTTTIVGTCTGIPTCLSTLLHKFIRHHRYRHLSTYFCEQPRRPTNNSLGNDTSNSTCQLIQATDSNHIIDTCGNPTMYFAWSDRSEPPPHFSRSRIAVLQPASLCNLLASVIYLSAHQNLRWSLEKRPCPAFSRARKGHAAGVPDHTAGLLAGDCVACDRHSAIMVLLCSLWRAVLRFASTIKPRVHHKKPNFHASFPATTSFWGELRVEVPPAAAALDVGWIPDFQRMHIVLRYIFERNGQHLVAESNTKQAIISTVSAVHRLEVATRQTDF